MKIYITKQQIAKIIPRTFVLKLAENYGIDLYEFNREVFTVPSSEVPLAVVMDLAKAGIRIEDYETWVEIPNADLTVNVPVGVSFEKYMDNQDPPVEQTRTWGDLPKAGEGDASLSSFRYWDGNNTGLFNYQDIELIQADGYTVFNLEAKNRRENEPSYNSIAVSIEDINYIDKKWSFSYFDYVEAWLTMKEVYEAKGGDDDARWTACTDEEKEIIVRWNIQKSLLKIDEIFDPTWSEGRKIKALVVKYRENEFNARAALTARFNDWYTYLNNSLSASGRTKFNSDYSWIWKEQYINDIARQFSEGETNNLTNYTNVTLAGGGYNDADFIGTTVTKTQVVSILDEILTSKQYFI